MPFPNYIGKKRLWTKELVDIRLKEAAAEIWGKLPCSDEAWNRIKKGRLDWPPASWILKYYGSISRAWLAVGARPRRVTLRNVAWTLKEEEYLLLRAGNMMLVDIARNLRRSYQAVRSRLNKNLGLRARDNQGYLSAAELAKEYNCPYHRVRDALKGDVIKGRYDKKRNRWHVDMAELTARALLVLTAPKEHSYKSYPPDVGDYYKRYGLKRTMVHGRIERVLA